MKSFSAALEIYSEVQEVGILIHTKTAHSGQSTCQKWYGCSVHKGKPCGWWYEDNFGQTKSQEGRGGDSCDIMTTKTELDSSMVYTMSEGRRPFQMTKTTWERRGKWRIRRRGTKENWNNQFGWNVYIPNKGGRVSRTWTRADRTGTRSDSAYRKVVRKAWQACQETRTEKLQPVTQY